MNKNIVTIIALVGIIIQFLPIPLESKPTINMIFLSIILILSITPNEEKPKSKELDKKDEEPKDEEQDNNDIAEFAPNEIEPIVENDFLKGKALFTASQCVKNSDVSILNKVKQGEVWREFERELNYSLDKVLLLVEERFHPYTTVLFLPDYNDNYNLRAHISRDKDLNHDAIIENGVGLIGSYIKEGKREALINDLVNGYNLPYHKDSSNVKSLIMAPLVAVRSSGFIIVDSTEKDAFTQEDLDWLEQVGIIGGGLLYYGYLYQQHQISHMVSDALNSKSAKLISATTLDDFLDIIISIVKDSFCFDRLSISIKENIDSNTVNICRVKGIEKNAFSKKEYELDKSSLANNFYNEIDGKKSVAITRKITRGEYQIRYSSDEIQTSQLKSYAGFPIGVESCRGLLLLELTDLDGYSSADMDSIKKIISLASIALEKILIQKRNVELATCDILTGLYNHRQFQNLLEESIARSNRTGKSETDYTQFALVMCDIDLFKKVNDLYGHKFGDTILKEISNTLNSGIRSGVDYSARYGGEEFALIIYGSSNEETLETIERIRKNIEKLSFTTAKSDIVNTTMSFGISFYKKDSVDPKGLINKAEIALKSSKDSGRNKVTIYNSDNT